MVELLTSALRSPHAASSQMLLNGVVAGLRAAGVLRDASASGSGEPKQA